MRLRVEGGGRKGRREETEKGQGRGARGGGEGRGEEGRGSGGQVVVLKIVE